MHRATRPNQVWSWDITWLPTTVRGSYLYLYLIMDVWSRRIVGWRIAEREQRHHARECAVLARRHELYERVRGANPERWSGSTRNWLPIGLVVLNPERAPDQHAA